jgi:pyruvate/2-oxoglutarate dehydrogenase complex dihydrolipoamide acyltransferase (E2) component
MEQVDLPFTVLKVNQWHTGVAKAGPESKRKVFDAMFAMVMGQVTWGADHRVIDGATVAHFCNEWKLLIEQPERLFLHLR